MGKLWDELYQKFTGPDQQIIMSADALVMLRDEAFDDGIRFNLTPLDEDGLCNCPECQLERATAGTPANPYMTRREVERLITASSHVVVDTILEALTNQFSKESL